MNNQIRKDLYVMLNGLFNKISDIAESTDDIETSDQLLELAEVIDERANNLIFERDS